MAHALRGALPAAARSRLSRTQGPARSLLTRAEVALTVEVLRGPERRYTGGVEPAG